MDANSGVIVQKLPTEQEWEEMKSIIRRLYLDEEKNLPEVMEIMKEAYGFKATTQMYKKRIMRWKFRKYSRSEEKESALDQMEGRGFHLGSSVTTINGVNIKTATIKRYAKRRKHLSRHAWPMRIGCSEEARRSMALNLQGCSPGRPLNGAADANSVEHVLWTIKSYASVCLENSPRAEGDRNKVLTDSSGMPGRLFNQMKGAFSHLRSEDYDLATMELSTIGSNARAAIGTPNIGICQTLLLVAIETRDDFRITEYKRVLLDYFRLELQAMHGCHHPVSILVDFMRLSDSAKLPHSVALIRQAMRDCYQRILGWDHQQSIEIELDATCKGDLDTTSRLLWKCDKLIGRNSAQSLTCLLHLCKCFCDRSDSLRLESVTKELLERAPQLSSLRWRRIVVAEACHFQAEMKIKECDWAAAEQFIRAKVLPALAEDVGVGSTLYASWCHDLVYCLRKQGKWAEVGEANAYLTHVMQLLQHQQT